MSRTEFTPEKIYSLANNEIFVFGSNLAGHHSGGAAREARNHFGAVWGQGVGLQGQSYAIPTMQGPVDTIRPYVDDFIDFAKKHPDLKFLVTPIGCGIAGFKPFEIAPLFKAGLDLDNVVLPKTFVDILTENSTVAEMRYERKARLVAVFQDTLAMISEKPSLAEAIKQSISRTRFYPEKESPSVNRNLGKNVKVSVTDHRTFQAASLMNARSPERRIAVLNFASATNPGGGVKSGSAAQEESLCRCSTLYPVLDQEILREKYYSFHRFHGNHLYTNSCIYTPDIKIIKSDENQPERLPEDKWINVDVITCAAPNFRAANPLPDEELYELHIRRGRKILDVALDNGAESLVLGAFGCGAFRNNPSIVASAYANLVKEYSAAFDEIEFAVFYHGNETVNYKTFSRLLG